VPIIQVIRRINGEEVWVPAFQQWCLPLLGPLATHWWSHTEPTILALWSQRRQCDFFWLRMLWVWLKMGRYWRHPGKVSDLSQGVPLWIPSQK
jgi:hypothetical protein